MYSRNVLEDNRNCASGRLLMSAIHSHADPTWVAITVSLPPVDPLAACASLAGASLYWERPTAGEAVAGFGILSSVEEARPELAWPVTDRLSSAGQVAWLNSVSADPPPGPWFGGCAFDLRRRSTPIWTGFPPSKWILPELLVWRRDGRSYVTGFQSPSRAREARAMVSECAVALEQLGPAECIGAPADAELRVWSDRKQWRELVDRALRAIEARSLSKVVLARRIGLASAHPLEPTSILAMLRQRVPGCTLFCLRSASGAHFLGATPETLCRVKGRSLETEALAGSAPNPGEPPLASADKESREHGAVVEGIDQAIRPLCDAVEIDASPSVLGLPYLRHLRTAIRGRLRAPVRLSEVVSALHPTAAVGGTPRDRALTFLAENEDLDRGWYAGPIGWLGEGKAELAVAIRSALVRGREAQLFVGAGVVAGSTADGEWEETEAKSRTLLEAMRGGCVG